VRAKFQKSWKLYPGKIVGALDLNGRYGVLFDDGDKDEVRYKHVRPKLPAVFKKKPSNSRNIPKIPKFCCPACNHVQVRYFVLLKFWAIV